MNKPIALEFNEKWAQEWFKAAQADIHWAKNQSWNGLTGTLALIAAMFAASKVSAIPQISWMIGVVVVAAISMWWQYDLHAFTAARRANGKAIADAVTGAEGIVYHREADRNNVQLLTARMFLIGLAAAVTFWEIVAR